MSWLYAGPPPRFGHTALCVDDRYMFVFFGCGGSTFFLDDVHMFDTQTYRWTLVPIQMSASSLASPSTLPSTPQSPHSRVTGGQNSLPRSPSSSFLLGHLRARANHTSCLATNNTIYVFGGRTVLGDVNELHVLTLQQNRDSKGLQWQLACRSASVRGKHA
jgi:hypothetical protein